MRSNHVTLAILFAILVAPLRGEVIESTAAGFIVRNTATINAPPATVYAALTDSIGGWWDPAHTFSHDAHNLSLDAKPGGCFCERLPDGGGVQHMRVVYASSDKLLRLTGAIGPLQEAALVGTMSWNLLPTGGGTAVDLSYTVGGFRAGGFRDLATVVDGVLRGQLARLKAFVETDHPKGPCRHANSNEIRRSDEGSLKLSATVKGGRRRCRNRNLARRSHPSACWRFRTSNTPTPRC